MSWFSNRLFNFFIFILLTASLTALEEKIPYLTSECDVLALVDGVVNAHNGKLVQINQDIHIDGSDPLTLTRYYDGGHHFESDFGYGIGCEHPALLTFYRIGDDFYANVELRLGLEVLCEMHKDRSKGKKHYKGSVSKNYFKSGYTNCCEALLRGEPSVYAMKLELDAKKGYACLTLGDGTRRHYVLFGGDPYVGDYYRLYAEERNNGNLRIFDYLYEGYLALRSIFTKNYDESLVLNRIDFNYHDQKVSLKGSNGQKTYYELCEAKGKIKKGTTFHKRTGGMYEQLLLKSHVDNTPPTEYNYLTNTKSRHTLFSLKKVREPNGRFLKVKFDSTQRVKELFTSGHHDPVYTFDYHSDYTLVRDALGGKKTFEFSNRRLTKLSENHCIQTYRWDERGQLLYHAHYDSSGKLIFWRKYSYDDIGNILEVKLKGCITEKGSQDTASIKYTYTKDCNRVNTETHNDQVQYRYSYLHKTTLLTSKLTFDGTKCVEREFYLYDKNRILVCTIVDDGSGDKKEDFTDVTYRKVTEIEPQLNPELDGLTLPSSIKEFYVDPKTTKKHLLRRVERRYKGDLLVEEKVFDAKDQYKYSLKFKYNNRRELISETNSLGEETTYEYDDNGNKVFEEKVGSGKKTVFKYDDANQLIEEIEYHDHKTLTKMYEYDCLGNRISATDIYGNITRYEFDLAFREISETDPLGNQERKEYDSLGNVTQVIDKEGFCTKTCYNIAGKPLYISYPDKTSKKYVYNIQGDLVKEWFRDGTYVIHEVDYRGRATHSKTYSKEGALLKTCMYQYKGQNLLSEIDPMGNLTEYKYDGAGRKLAKIEGDKKTSYTYDTLGRLSLTTCGNRVEVKEFDYLDRLIEERIEDLKGATYAKSQYAYDLFGNRILQRIYKDESHFAETKSIYNSQSMPIKEVDALGNETHLEYRQKHHFERQIKDPLGRKTIEIFDPLLRLKERKIFSAKDHLVARTTFSYDKRGYQKERQEEIFYDGDKTGTHKVETTYDAMGQKLTEIEQGTRATRWFYQKGRLKKIHLPDGTLIRHSYDSLGRLIKQLASDGSIQYTFSYDLNDNLIEAKDLSQNTITLRAYDTHNRLVYEKQGTGFECSYAYDLLDHLVEMKFGKNSIRYTYSPTSLISSTRFKSGKPLYTCKQTCDWRGKLLKTTHPHTISTTFKWDSIGRCTSIDSHNYRQQLTYDPVGNLTTIQVNDLLGTYNSTYTYDSQNQLRHEKGLFKNSYKHDSIFNRISCNNIPYKLDHLNQLLQCEDNIFTYDPNGRRIAKNKSKYVYDALGRLTQFTENNQTTTYTYDPLGRLIRKVTPDLTQEFYYQFDTEIASSSSSHTEFRLVHGPYATQAIELDDIVYTPIRNHRGDICQLHHPQQTSTIRYDAFGNFAFEGTLPPWLFSGQRFDPTTHLYHFEKRFYDPTLGRWLTPDPLSFTDGPNLYAYVHNNPLIYVDPYGLLSFEINEFCEGFTRHLIDEAAYNLSTHFLGEYQPKTLYANMGCIAGSGGGMLLGLVTGSAEIKMITKVKGLVSKTISVLENSKKGFQLKERIQGIKRGFSTPTTKKIDKQAKLFGKTDKINSGAENVNAQKALQCKLNQIEDFQKDAYNIRKLKDGRIRYYGIEIPSGKKGFTRGACNVLEWDPKTLKTRWWYESRDHFGNVTRVHPKSINGQNLKALHYPLLGSEK